MGPGMFLSLFFCHLLWLASGNPVKLGGNFAPFTEPEDLGSLHDEDAPGNDSLCDMRWKPRKTSQGMYCYRYFETPTTFYDAEEECQSYGGIVHLASIHNKADSDFLTTLVENADNVWIGLRAREGCIFWNWTDGTQFNQNYAPWDCNQPALCASNSPGCVKLSETTGHCKWIEVGCENKSGYICEVEAGN